MEANGLFNIYVVVHVATQRKVERYLRDYLKPNDRTTLKLVVVHEEETESANALKLMQVLEEEQTSVGYVRRGRMDDLAFNKEEIVVLEGNALINFPLQEIMS